MGLSKFQQLGHDLYEKLHLPTYPEAITNIKNKEKTP